MTTPAVAADRPRAILRVLLVAAAVTAALPFSLLSLAQDYQHGAVLGELALVPVCAFALALVAAYRHPWVLQLRAGRADYTVAAAAFVPAVALVVWGPVAAGNHHFALRPDLLALPLVAIAAVCLLFGVRALVAFAVPIGVAALAWPLPLRAALEPVTEGVTSVTSAAVRGLVEVLPLASVAPGSGDLRLVVAGPDAPFEVVVASACSGIAGIVGMLLVGLSAQYVLHGRPRARLAWLATGVLLAWVLNLVRILALLAVGRAMGEDVAMDVVHPFAGLVLLNGAMVLQVLLARRFGLVFGLRRPVPSDTPLTAPAPATERRGRGPLARRATALVSGVTALAVLGGAVPGAAAAYDGTAVAVVPFAETPTLGPEFEVVDADEKTWARRYFGADSSWMRYRAVPASPATGYSVWVDSILTPDWSGLRAHPLLECYSFHDFELVSIARPTLAGGLLADEVVYRRPDGATWHVVSWEWAVRTEAGEMAHERVTLLASSLRTDLDPGTDAAPRDGGLRTALAERLAPEGTGTDPNPRLTAALRGDANAIIDAHLLSGGGTDERTTA